MESNIVRYSVMPIPPVEKDTTWFDAGRVKIGIEYRELDDAVAEAAAADLEAATGDVRGQVVGLDDQGISIHVNAVQDGEEREFLRFDCFESDPHYHYISWRDHSNEMLIIDTHAVGDPVEFALNAIEERLDSLLSRAGAADVAKELDPLAIEHTLHAIRAEVDRLSSSPTSAQE